MAQTPEYRNLSSLKLWDKNPRSIKDKDFQRLKKQITELGQYKPLLILEDGTVIGGNMRLRAYQEMGVQEVWVSVVPAKTEEEILKYALSDNDRAGYYDDDLLANLSSDYPNFEWGDYAVDLTPPTTIDTLLKDEIEEDEAPEVDEGEPVSKLGEIYQLGRHRLMCGDSTKIEDVESLMNGQKADMVFTDPPYGVSVNETNWIPGYKRGPAFDHKLSNDELRDEGLTEFIKSVFINAVVCCKDTASYYSFSAPLKAGYDMLAGLVGAGIHIQGQIVWVKPNLSLGQSDYQWRHEICWYGYIKDKSPHNWYGGRTETTVWDSSRESDGSHPTMKPIAIVSRALNNSSKSDDIVLDLFGGSGSTLIACEQANRDCYMMELDPKYCDVIRKRYAKFVGKEEEWQKI